MTNSIGQLAEDGAPSGGGPTVDAVTVHFVENPVHVLEVLVFLVRDCHHVRTVEGLGKGYYKLFEEFWRTCPCLWLSMIRMTAFVSERGLWITNLRDPEKFT